MKNYIMTKNYAKTFKLIAIFFVVLAVITAVAIPLSLSQQISDAAALEQQQTADAISSATPTVPGESSQQSREDGHKGDHEDDHDGDHDGDHDDEEFWKSKITPLTAANYIIIGAAIVLWSVLILVYWLNVVAWLYKSAVNEKMNKSLWPILGLFFNLFAVAAFCIVRDRPRYS